MNDVLFGVKDSPVIARMVKQNIRANRKRNVFIMLTIALTAFMITSLLSMGMSYYHSINMQSKRLEGSLSHMAFANPTQEQMETIYKLDYVKAVGIGSEIGTIIRQDQLKDVRLSYVDKNQWEKMFSPTFPHIEGHYPRKVNEIMVSTYLLDLMQVKDPTIGMPIRLTYEVTGTGEKVEETFEIACIYEDFSQGRSNRIATFYVSRELAQGFKRLALDQVVVNVLFKDDQVEKRVEHLKKDLMIDKDQPYILSPAYRSMGSQGSTYLLFGGLIFFFMMTGFLLIYNVMYISIASNVRFYGMLRTIGATGRQIKKVVMGQVLWLSFLAIPIGMVFSLGVTLGLLPRVLVNSGIHTGPVIIFSPVIYIVGSLFTLLTTRIGMIVPLRKATDISPIEALRYNQASTGGGHYKKATGAKPFMMAIRHIRRDKKRAGVVLLSLVMGTISFSGVMVIVQSIHIDRYLEAEYAYDFSLYSDFQKSYFLDKEKAEEISRIPGIREMSRTTIGTMEVVATKELDRYTQWLSEKNGVSKEEVVEGQTYMNVHSIKGIDSLTLETLEKKSNRPIDDNAFLKGKGVILQALDQDLIPILSEVKNVSLLSKGEEGDKKIYTLPVVGILLKSEDSMDKSLRYSDIEILMSNNIIHDYIPSVELLALDFNVEKGRDEAIYNVLTGGDYPSLIVAAKFIGRKSMEEGKRLMTVLGGGMAIILDIIGLINFINVISVGIISRRRELAILESIGMTKKQIRVMVIDEGLIYAFMTIIISLTLGNGIVYGVFCLFKQAATYAVFTYPIGAMLFLYGSILLICYGIPYIAYGQMCKVGLIERLGYEG